MQDKRLKYGYSLIIVFLLFCNITTIAQSWIWSRQAKPIGAGIGEVSTDHSVATDNKGNSYYTGYFQDTISFGSYTLFPKSIRNFFLVKYNSNGNVLWAKQANEASIFSGGVGESVAIDNLGNVYVTGFFGDTVSFGGDTLRSHIFGNEEVFLTKYSSSGTVLWAKQSYSNDAQGNSIAVDKSGYIYITGFYVDTVSFDGDTLLTINPRGYDEVFLTKYSPGGTVLWANQANETKSGFSSAEGNSVATDNSGNIFITGRFIDTTSFGNDTIHTYSNGDIFLVKYAPSGVVLWAKQNNDIKNYANFQNGVSLATDNSNNIYITGFFWDSVAFGNDTLRSQMFYSNQAFLVKYAPNGNVLWAEQSNTPDSNSWYGFSVSIDTLKQCNGYLVLSNAEYRNPPYELYFGHNIFKLNTKYHSSTTLLQFDSNGNTICGNIFSEGNEDDGDGVSVSRSGKFIYLAGDISDTAVFAKDTLIYGIDMPFLARWQPCHACMVSPSVTGKLAICKGNTDSLSASGGNIFLWSDGETTQSINVSPDSSTIYMITISNDTCSVRDSIPIIVYPNPIVSYCCDASISSGQSVQLSATGGTSYFWAPNVGLNCDTCPNPVATPAITTTYTLTVTNDSICSVTKLLTIDVSCGNPFIPDAFSPNGDGQNDVLLPKGNNIATFFMAIFDRWGNKVFECENINEGWDGTYKNKPCETGTYSYYANGSYEDGKAFNKKGNITLVR